MTQIEYVGEGRLGALQDIIRTVGARKIFLFAGKSSYTVSGAHGYMERLLDVEIMRYDDLSPLPLEVDVVKATAAYKSFAPDLVLAIGGGHVMDIAKAVNFRCDRKPLIAAPTTSGSGAEATPFAVLYKDGIKTSLEDPEILPTYTIVDPALAQNAPISVVLASGLDALTQAVESYWARGATNESRGYAKEAMALVWPNLALAINGNSAAKTHMHYGAHLAGKAIAISRTTACHALSYGLTYRFGVPHGIAVAVFLPAMMRLNGVAMPNQEIAADAVARLLLQCKVPPLSSYGAGRQDIASLAAAVDRVRLGNNPRPLMKEDVINLYQGVL